MSWLDIFKKKEKEKPQITVTPTWTVKQRVMGKDEAIKHWSGIAIRARAEACGSIVPEVYNGGDKIEDSWLNELLISPNNNMQWNDLIELAVQWLDLDGNVYLYVPESGYYQGKPLYIDILPSDKVQCQIGKKGIEKYVYSKVSISPNDIIHIKTLSPNSNYTYSNLIGTPRILQSISSAILSETEKHEYMQEHYSRRAISPYVLIQSEDYEDGEKVIEMLRERVPENYRPLVMFPHGYSLDTIKSDTATQNAMTSSVGQGDLINEICSAFGTPKSLLTMEFNARATAEVAEISFYQKTVNPILNRIYTALNRKFAELDDLHIYYEIPNYDDYSLKIDNTLKLLGAGIIDLTTARNELGYELEEPQKFFHLKTYQNEYWKKWENLRLKTDEELEKDIQKTMKLMEKEILQNLQNGEFTNIFDVDEWKKIIEKNTFISRKDLIINSIIESLNDINFGFTDVETEYETELNESIEESADKISVTINTLDTELKNDITKILLEKPVDIEAALLSATASRFNQYYTGGRAKLIARTTTTLISEGSKDRVWTKYGYNKIWLSERDSQVRDAHRKADGQISKNGKFYVGGEYLRHPAGGSKAENNINCRCVIFPTLQ